MQKLKLKRILELRTVNEKGLEERRNDLLTEMETLVNKSTEEKRAMSSEEISKFNELKTEISQIDETLKIQEEARSLETSKAKTKEKKKEERTAEQIQEEELRAAMNTGTTADGGLVVGITLAKDIIKDIKDRSAVYSFFDNTSLKGDYRMLKKTASGKANWVKEKTTPDATPDATIPKLSVETLKQHRLYRESAITQQMLNSQEINLTGFIKEDVSESMVDAIEEAIFLGTGVEEPTGLISGIDKKQILAERGKITVDDLKRCKGKLKKKARKGAKWFMHNDVLLEVDLLKDAMGRPLLQPDLTQESDYTLLGSQVEVTDVLPTFESEGENCLIILANKGAYHTNTQKQIVLNTYDDSTYKRAGLIGYGSDVYMDGKPKNADLVSGIFNPGV